MTCFDEDPSPESFPCAVEGCLGDVISDKNGVWICNICDEAYGPRKEPVI